MALLHPRANREIRRGIKADQLHRHRAAARIRRGEEELRRCLGDSRHSTQIVEVVLLHIEMRGHALYEHALKRLCLCRLLRQHHNICPKPLLKAHESPLKPEQHLRAAKDHEREYCDARSQHSGTRRISAAVTQGKQIRKLHSFSPRR